MSVTHTFTIRKKKSTAQSIQLQTCRISSSKAEFIQILQAT